MLTYDAVTGVRFGIDDVLPVEPSNFVHVINRMSQLENCIERAAQKAADKGEMFLNYIPAANKPFGYYYVEGTAAYHLVRFWMNEAGQSCTSCSCVAFDLCYHIGAVVLYHIEQKRKLQAKKLATPVKEYNVPTTDANSAVGIIAKAKAEKLMQDIKSEATFTFTAETVGTCTWCDAEGVELDGFVMCHTCCKKSFDTRAALPIKATNHAYDKYKTVDPLATKKTKLLTKKG